MKAEDLIRGPHRTSLLTGLLGSLVFIALLLPFWGFTLDDAYIAFRFSRHVAEGHGPVWNIGEAPVEGYTSFLWMLLNAAAIHSNIDPVLFSKALGTLSSLGVIGLLAAAGRSFSRSFRVILLSAVAASPAIAFLTTQGLETPLATFLITAMAALSLRMARTPRPIHFPLFYALALLSMLTRPEASLFVAGALLSLLAHYRRVGQRAALRTLMLAGGLSILLGCLYMAWRFQTFGHLLPNTFYVKSGTGLAALRPTGAIYVLSFLATVLLPYGLLLLPTWRHRDSLFDWRPALPIFTGCAFFLLYLLTIDPIQGFFGRFAVPVMPALLLAGASLLRRQSAWPPSQRRLLPLAALAFVLWSLRTMPEAFQHQTLRHQQDRVSAGRALEGLEGSMFTTASGALPYYSRWRSADMLGLSSEHIAHHGLSLGFLRRMAPDLVVLRNHTPGLFRPRLPRHQISETYLLEEGFVAIAAIHRSFGYHLCYFARPDSPLYEPILLRLLNIDGAEYGDLSHLMRQSQIPTLQLAAKEGASS